MFVYVIQSILTQFDLGEVGQSVTIAVIMKIKNVNCMAQKVGDETIDHLRCDDKPKCAIRKFLIAHLLDTYMNSRLRRN